MIILVRFSLSCITLRGTLLMVEYKVRGINDIYIKLNNVQLTLKIMDNCVPEAQSLLREVSLSPEIAFNTPGIFFLEFLILGMMYTELAEDVT